MTAIGNSLLTTFDYVWERFTQRLVGMDDEEYLWEPVRHCWSLRPDPAGRWRLDGDGGGGPAPDPVPITTIAWRIGHVGGLALGGFADRLFADGSLTVAKIVFPSRADDVRNFLDANFQAWRRGMDSLDDEQWWHPLGAAWGPFAEACPTDVALHVADELVHHAAEISLLRDLYGRRQELGTP